MSIGNLTSLKLISPLGYFLSKRTIAVEGVSANHTERVEWDATNAAVHAIFVSTKRHSFNRQIWLCLIVSKIVQ